ncbi:phosphate ABC transporter permease subunit PstC [Mangrovitalea sediminis]|uniref:phosphate ABC transporter permease subunit PstC n=1 Tax=Mangrovitalea sediminis TaxID=1982043 RepID=UPI000BE4DC49|nr:phosphate ABC transporter permease subunit PstC [Mangrovitalea sediminis]
MEQSVTAGQNNVSAGKSQPGILGDRIFRGITQVSALFIVLVVFGIVGMLLYDAWPAIHKFGFGFLTSKEWNPVAEQFGAVSAIFGTLVTSAIAMVIGVPVSFGVALFITELAPAWLKRPIGTAIELLAAIPSIIYGLWGLFVFAPWFADNVEPWLTDNLGNWPIIGPLFNGPPMGIGILTAGIILSVMIIPFMAAVMRDVFDSVPAVLKESAHGLGSTTWEVVWKVVLPYTRVGVVGGVMLGLGRALGETMAVTFVIGNSHDISASLLMPGNTISSTLANEFTEATGQVYMSSLIYLGLVLFAITFVVLALAKLLLLKLNAKEGKKS